MKSVLEYIENNNLGFMRQSELAKLVSIALNRDNAEVYQEISNLLDEGDLYMVGDKKIVSSRSLNLKKGILHGNPRGFAFCKLIDSDEPDVFIPNVNLKHALHKDKVLIKIHKKNDKTEGEVVKIIKRFKDNIVGLFMALDADTGFVKPDEANFFKDIYVKNAKKFKVKNNDKVVVRIEKYDSKGKNPEGVIVENLGAEGQKGVDVLSILREFNMYEEFEPQVLEDAKKIPQQVKPEQLVGREDFRNEVIVTIDGEDSKDFDDAVNVWKAEDGNWMLGVHIADVSNYVKINTALDREAYKRGTSAYFVDRVLPMLPVELSNGICSLNPNVDRLTMSVIMKIDENGKVIEHKICNSVIRSAARMTYTEVFAILNDDPEMCEKYKDMVQNFKNMEILHNILLKKRIKRGALDFDLPECVIDINEFGRVVDVRKFERNTAHKIIESFMLEANETVAEHICNLGLPCMYRVHEQPDSMKMGNFFALLSSIGEHIKSTPEKVTPKQLQQLLVRVKDKPYSEVVNKVMLRSLQKARYASKNLGHYGLAAEFYCHFTSPIRRYPDLMVHRILKNCVLNKPDQARLDFYNEFIGEACLLSSEREQLAESAERAVDELKKTEYMLDKVGNRYKGTISGATSFGVFVELDNTVEGMCAINDLPEDTYTVIENQYMLKGKRHQYQLGGKVEVEVLSVNLKRRQINFKILDDKSDEKLEENNENSEKITENS